MQTKFLQKIKWYKPFLVFCVLVIQTLFINQIFAQQVGVQLLQPPPNQLRQTDLWKVMLINTDTTTYRFRLVGTLDEEKAGRVIDGQSGILSLPPGSKTITYDDVISGGSVNFISGKWREAFTRTGMAPSGDYTICIYVMTEEGYELGSDCIQQLVEITSPPILIFPANEDTLLNYNPAFTWIYPGKPGIEGGYKITIVEMSPNQDPYIAMESNPIWYTEDNIETTSYFYPTSARKFEQEKDYAWMISAGKLKSEIFSFRTVKKTIIAVDTTINIRLVSPTEEQPAPNNRPTFEWDPEPAIEGMTYTIIVREIEEGFDPESGTILFERSGIRETSLPYPAKIQPLDTTKVYVWKVTGIKNAKVIAVSQLVPIWWHWSICVLFPWPLLSSSQDICLGSTPSKLCAWAIMFGTGITGRFEWELTDPNGPTQTGFEPTGWYAYVCVLPTIPPTPGVYTYTLSVTRGKCKKSKTFTVNVYPNLGPATISVDPVCSGRDDAELTLNINPPDAQVFWEYEDIPSGGWNNIPWGNGISINTNIIEAIACSTPPLQQVTRTYRATVDLSQWGLPATPPISLSCPNDATVDVVVDCPTRAGNILVTTTSGHTMDNYKICSDKDGDGSPDYPVLLNVILGGTTIGTEVWKVFRNGISVPNSLSGSFTIDAAMGAATYKFSVTVTNGSCDPITRTRTITVVDPPPMPEIEVIKIEDMPPYTDLCPFNVCPHDDAVLRIKNLSDMPPGTKYKWYYAANSLNCPTPNPPGGLWTFAGEGYEQNTNEIGPLMESWTNVWWIVTAEDQDGVCNPVLSACCEIKVIQPPCAPIIADPSPNPKCSGDAVTLTATIPSGCGTIVSYQWYLNGKPYSNSPPPISVTTPGNYYLVVQGECESAQSNTVEVIDHTVEVTITGQCCSEGNDITLTASGTSTCPPGTGTYSWSDGLGSGPTITVNPVETTTYTVTFTDACGCKATTQFTITVCY